MSLKATKVKMLEARLCEEDIILTFSRKDWRFFYTESKKPFERNHKFDLVDRFSFIKRYYLFSELTFPDGLFLHKCLKYWKSTGPDISWHWIIYMNWHIMPGIEQIKCLLLQKELPTRKKGHYNTSPLDNTTFL